MKHLLFACLLLCNISFDFAQRSSRSTINKLPNTTYQVGHTTDNIDTIVWANIKHSLDSIGQMWWDTYVLAEKALRYHMYTFMQAQCDSIWEIAHVETIAQEMWDEKKRHKVEKKLKRKCPNYQAIEPDHGKADVFRFFRDCERLARYAIQYDLYKISQRKKKKIIMYHQQHILQEKMRHNDAFLREIQHQVDNRH